MCDAIDLLMTTVFFFFFFSKYVQHNHQNAYNSVMQTLCDMV